MLLGKNKHYTITVKWVGFCPHCDEKVKFKLDVDAYNAVADDEHVKECPKCEGSFILNFYGD